MCGADKSNESAKLTTELAIAYLGVNSRDLFQLRAKGFVIFTYVTKRQIRYLQSDLDKVLISCRVEAKSLPTPFEPNKKRVWLSSEDICKDLTVNLKSLEKLRASKSITYYKFGHKTIRYDLDDYNEFYNSKTIIQPCDKMVA